MIALMIALKMILKEIWDALSKFFKRILRWLSKNWFYTTLIAVAVIGGVCAFLVVPFVVPQPFSKDDSISTLRQAVLVATGGVLAILTLWENRRKNEQDHIRQVHAERRIRYATAIEQLADEKAPIRLGGVYTLVKLVDEWLADEKTLPSEEERHKEGQVIINNLCTYIRSPFDLALKAEDLSKNKVPENYEGRTQQFVKDQARFREEKEFRLTILEAIRDRLNKGTRIHKNGTQKLLPGQWSDFDYDFSNAHFFYPVDFNSSYFGASSNFSGVEFTGNANFSRTEFTGNANFSRTEFTGNANFSWVSFTESATFSWAKFTEYADFSWASFTESATFSWAKFTEYADFSGASFTEYAYFSGASFTEYAYFSGASFTGSTTFSGAKFTGNATFFEAEFTQDAGFSGVSFTGSTTFSGASFTGSTTFSGAKFTGNATFFEAEFTQDAGFAKASFTGSTTFSGASFTGSTTFSGAKFTGNADFFEAEFTQDAGFAKASFTGSITFSKTHFHKDATFSGSNFTQGVDFSRAKFTGNSDFSGVTFTQSVDFSGATFEGEPIFEYVLNNKTYEAMFSCKVEPENYNFEVSSESPYRIETRGQEHNGIEFTIPKGTILFDPNEPPELDDNENS